MGALSHYVIAADRSHQVQVTMSADQFDRNWHGRICIYSSHAEPDLPVRDCPDFSAWLDAQAASKRSVPAPVKGRAAA